MEERRFSLNFLSDNIPTDAVVKFEVWRHGANGDRLVGEASGELPQPDNISPLQQKLPLQGEEKTRGELFVSLQLQPHWQVSTRKTKYKEHVDEFVRHCNYAQVSDRHSTEIAAKLGYMFW